MLSFRTWLRGHEGSLIEGKKRRPDNRVDDFLTQIMGLADDMDKASKVKKPDLPAEPTVKTAPGQDQLMGFAKAALANLSRSPDYYKTRASDLKAGGVQGNGTGKITRSDALRAARELGVNFGKSEFDQEAFRKGIEAEFNRGSAFSRDYDPKKKLV